MKKTIKLSASISLAAVIMFAVFAVPVYAVDKNAVIASGDYNVGTSVYGSNLTKSQLDEVAEKLVSFLDYYILPEMTEAQKVRAAWSYMILHCEYASSSSKNGANTAWGALVYGEARGEGYARAFKALCDGMDIGCYYVSANDKISNKERHWNIVRVDGNWYHMDVQACASGSLMRIFYYLVSDERFGVLDMEWNRWDYPPCLSNYYEDDDYPNRDFSDDKFFYVDVKTITVLVDGKPIEVDACNIDGNNYFILRDIAYMLNGTAKQFDVKRHETYDDEDIIVYNQPYTKVGGELETTGTHRRIAFGPEYHSYTSGMKDNRKTFIIMNKEYHLLRDISEMANFNVSWDGSHILIDTSKDGQPPRVSYAILDSVYSDGIYCKYLDQVEKEGEPGVVWRIKLEKIRGIYIDGVSKDITDLKDGMQAEIITYGGYGDSSYEIKARSR